MTPRKKHRSQARKQHDRTAQLASALNQLSMTVVASRIQDQLLQAEKEHPSYSLFLEELLDLEISARRERKVKRRVKRARLAEVKSLDEFDFAARPKLSPPALKELLECRFVEEGRSILCVGRPGTGKTHVAKALAHAACLKGYSVLCGVTADILDEMHAALADNTFPKVFRRYSRADLLLLDEIGYLNLDKAKAANLFRLVSARHPSRSMIVTSNTGFAHWGRFFPNEAQAIATVDRLLDRATVLRFTGKSFRAPKEILGGALD